ncbi:MAG: magnesium/cobalt transporter CorA [SAR324 cluster bacterium]|nr:magnesium/cobalt transporter CorA [SAR324 cluster bacterium]MBF0349436.1 magnesium/cobalt transporter CorA [SAR324 cluster bacterium]
MKLPSLVLTNYDATFFEEKPLKELGFSLSLEQGVSWLDLCSFHDNRIIPQIQHLFEMHPLLLKNILNIHEPPRIEEFSNCLLIILKNIFYDVPYRKVRRGQIAFILGDHFVITLQEYDFGIFDSVRKNLRNTHNKIRKMGADYLVYTLIDAVVENYFKNMEQIEQQIELLQEAIMNAPEPQQLQQIYYLRREIMAIHNFLLPMREAIRFLQKGQLDFVEESNLIYFRDLYEQTAQLVDMVVTYRDTLSASRNAFHSATSTRLNHVMKVLTIISGIFMPPTLITTIYGMNFDHMPELGMKWGYPLCMLAIMVIALFTLFYLKRKDLL